LVEQLTAHGRATSLPAAKVRNREELGFRAKQTTAFGVNIYETDAGSTS
jgi:hypothetical protein